MSLLPSLWPLPLRLPPPSLMLSPTPSPLSLPLPIAIAVGHCHCSPHQPLPPPSLLCRRQRSPLPSPSPLPSAIDVSITIGHCSCYLHWPSPSPLPLAISESCCLGAVRIVFDQLKQRMLIFFFCSDSGRCTDQSWMTDQVSSGNVQHQHWAASSKHQGKRQMREVAGSRGAAGGQQGGDAD